MPSLDTGMVLIIDNARFHKSKRVVDLIKKAGCTLFFLPPYSPDFNPIENYWSSIKHAIKKVANFFDDFFQAIVASLNHLCKP